VEIDGERLLRHAPPNRDAASELPAPASTGRQRRARPPIPERIAVGNAVTSATEVLRRPRWPAGHLRSAGIPALSGPNMARTGAEAPRFFDASGAGTGSALPRREDPARSRKQWGGPFMVTTTPRRAVEAVG
jgi:hypothetical protein